jgi:hypothetical protein
MLTNGIVDGLAAVRKGFTQEEKKKYDENWDKIFGKKSKNKIKKNICSQQS